MENVWNGENEKKREEIRKGRMGRMGRESGEGEENGKRLGREWGYFENGENGEE